MIGEIVLDGKTYVSSKRASEITGYAQDYIGQLARNAHVDARRVGGLWYVFMDSLESYKSNPEGHSTKTDRGPKPIVTDNAIDNSVIFEGKEFISANRASQITGYNQDYIGQLARSGKVLARQVGNRWYINQETLLSHKTEKDNLLAAVQSSSVGLATETIVASADSVQKKEAPLLRYNTEPTDLNPSIRKNISNDVYRSEFQSIKAKLEFNSANLRPSAKLPTALNDTKYLNNEPLNENAAIHTLRLTSKKSQENASLFGKKTASIGSVALLIMIILGIFLFMRTQDAKKYTIFDGGGMFMKMTNTIEQIVSPELTYNR